MLLMSTKRAFHSLDLNLFRVFDVVLREGNLTRAAEHLFVSQSAVSHALARLRDQFGDPLFVRSARGVEPTSFARTISNDVRQALALMETASNGDRIFDPAKAVEEVKVAMSESAEPFLLRVLLECVKAAAPRARVTSVRLSRNSMSADLAVGRIDCAIDIARPVPTDVAHSPLAQDEFIVASRRRRVLTADTYLAGKHVVVSGRSKGLSVEDVEFSRLSLHRNIEVRCQTYEAALHIAAQSDLMLTMPRRLAASINGRLGAHLLTLPIDMPALQLHTYWHQSRSEDPANVWLRERIREALVTRTNERSRRRN